MANSGTNDSMDGGPPPLKRFKSDERGLIVVLERCQLETAKIGSKYELLSSEKHGNFLRKMNKQATDYRPDIAHQCLLMLFDSPLNRAGLLRVFMHTERNVLIEIAPQTRFPRTYDRFAGLMVELLHKMSIRATEGSTRLLNAIKNPITDHLPVGCRKVGTSYHSPKFLKWSELVPPADGPDGDGGAPIVVVIGAMAKGKITPDYIEEEIRLSNYPLSAALTCAKLTSAFEEAWGVI